MSEMTSTKTRTSSQTLTREESSVSSEVSKVGMISIAAFGAIIGGWSLIALVSAMVQNGGPLELVSSWFKAVAGL